MGVEEPNEAMTFSQLVDLAEKNDRNKPVPERKTMEHLYFMSKAEWYALSYDVAKAIYQ